MPTNPESDPASSDLAQVLCDQVAEFANDLLTTNHDLKFEPHVPISRGDIPPLAALYLPEGDRYQLHATISEATLHHDLRFRAITGLAMTEVVYDFPTDPEGDIHIERYTHEGPLRTNRNNTQRSIERFRKLQERLEEERKLGVLQVSPEEAIQVTDFIRRLNR